MAKLLFATLTFLMLALPARAETFRIFIASDDDLYLGDILKFALKAQGGGHTVEVVRGAEIAQGRALRVLEDGHAGYDVIYSAFSPEREKHLAMVKFPLTRGLLGYRVLAMRSDRIGRIKPSIPFETLQSDVCFGSGRDWPDTTVLQKAGLCVVTGNDPSLWPMLARGRYDAFPRGLIEIAAEMQHEAIRYKGVTLVLDPSVMLAYRQDLFFFLPRQEKAKAAIIREGLDKANADGSYDRFFYSIPTIRTALEEIRRHSRTTFHLGTPEENRTLAMIPDQYWYRFDDASAFADYLSGVAEH